MEDSDYALAKKLQEDFDKDSSGPEVRRQSAKRRNSWSENELDLNRTQHLVHPEWETLDPTPDIFSMKNAFDDKFFQGRLKCVLLEWSKKMYSCAGICYSQKNGMGMSIIIRLSEPLLKLRARKDLVETLLHEMIHAYCFVLNIREPNGGHGPYFKKMMHGINKVAGTNISVYHTFHDEVDLYKVHWWRCNGVCQHRKPFFGFVKRSSNRAPGSYDYWWMAHQQSCGGNFLKVREPPPKKRGPKKKEKSDTVVKPNNDLRKYFDSKNIDPFIKPDLPYKIPGHIPSNNYPKGSLKSNNDGTLLLNSKTSTKTSGALEKDYISKPSNENNVVGFKDLMSTSTPVKKNSFTNLTGDGYSLSSSNQKSEGPAESVDRNKLRDIWSKRFLNSNTTKSAPILNADNKEITVLNTDENEITEPGADEMEIIKDTADQQPSKKQRVSSDKCWVKINEDVEICDTPEPVIYLSSDDDDNEATEDDNKLDIKDVKPIKKLTPEEFQTQIKDEILGVSEFGDDEIEIIDGEYYDDKDLSFNSEIADTSLVDDLFGEDTLLRDFNLQNAVVPSSSNYIPNSQDDIISCPICQEKITRNHFEDHLDGCVGVTRKILPKSAKAWAKTSPKNLPTQIRKPVQPFYTKFKKKVTKNTAIENLKKAGYSEQEILKAVASTNESSGSSSNDENLNSRDNDTMNQTEEEKVSCPVCSTKIKADSINDHLDQCLQN